MISSLNSHLENSFVRLAITETSFLKLVNGQVNPEHFSSSITESIIILCLNYFSQFGEAPGNHFHDELVRLTRSKDEDTKLQYVTYVKKILEMSLPNQKYVLERIADFVKVREREIALPEAADALANGDLEGHDNLLYAALKTGIVQQDIGLDYLTDYSNIGMQSELPFLVDTGVPALDRLMGHFSRKQFICYLGGYKSGKTWALQNLGKAGVRWGLKVCHISFECTKEEMEIRYDMMFSGRGTRHIGEVVDYWHLNERDELKTIHHTIRPLNDIKAVTSARRAAHRLGGRLIIKKYPMGRCSPNEVERYLNYLEAHENFIPDILILDYIDIMDLSCFGTEHRHKLNQGYIWAKGLADERNILVATVSQVAGQALKKKWPTEKDVAEDKRKTGNVDVLIAIGRGDAEVENNTAGLSVIANRSGRQGGRCSVSLCFDIGQFCLSSWIGDKDDSMASSADDPD